MKSVIVTGGAGFIGSNLCKRLLKNGIKVVAIDNLITGTEKNITELKKNNNFSFIYHDIVQPLTKTQLQKIEKTDAIFHLACPTGVPNLVTLAEEMLLTCSLGTRNILELAVMHKARVLFTSSSEVYGDPEKFPQTESYTGNVDPVGIRSPYEEGKRYSESIISMYVRKYNVDAKIVRVFNTYGPQMSLTDMRVIPHFLACIQNGPPLPVQGDGLQKRTFCYIDDLINGTLLVHKKGEKGEVYNVGSSKEITIKGLAGRLAKLTGRDVAMKTTQRPDHDHKRRKPDLKKINELGWLEDISLDEGLRRTIEWYGL